MRLGDAGKCLHVSFTQANEGTPGRGRGVTLMEEKTGQGSWSGVGGGSTHALIHAGRRRTDGTLGPALQGLRLLGEVRRAESR